MKSLKSALLAIGLCLTSLSAVATPVQVSITQLVPSTFGLQAATDGSFSQISPTPTNYVINNDFKFFLPSGGAPFLGSATGFLDSLIGTPTGGCNASDYSGFTAGSIALFGPAQCLFSTSINAAFAAGAIAAIVQRPTLGAANFGVAANVFIPAVIILGSLANSFDNTLQEPTTIDIKPGSDPNAINIRSKGLIPVAILGSMGFDATQVDSSTVMFGPNGAAPVHGGHISDVDGGDGFLDMVFHFKVSETGIACGDTDATLTGETFGGELITGTDAVKTSGCK